MKLHSLCHYRSKSDDWTDDWKNADYAARNVVKAVKQSSFNGHSVIKSDNRNFHISDTAAGRAAALEACALTLAKRIEEAGYEHAAVIPVPASDHVNPDAIFTGLRLAQAIESINSNLSCRPALYFNEVLVKAALGGTRNYMEIKHHLRWNGPGIGSLKIVLLDDVCTTGGHLRAAKHFLSDRGHEVEDAFVIARTAWKRPDKMFKVPVEQLC